MKTKGSIAFVLFILLSVSSYAQQTDKRFGFEFNGGASIATKKINASSVEPGFGFEGTLHYRFMPHLGIYGGWGWNKFASGNSLDWCFEETGYVLGLNFKHPINDTRLSYYLRAGGLYNHIETEDAEGEIINDSKHGFGFQLAGGIDINLGSNWSLTPGLKFNNLSKETNIEELSKELDYQYISARIGILKKF